LPVYCQGSKEVGRRNAVRVFAGQTEKLTFRVYDVLGTKHTHMQGLIGLAFQDRAHFWLQGVGSALDGKSAVRVKFYEHSPPFRLYIF
jgi:hypothetical protein